MAKSKKKSDLDLVRELALQLPNVEESTIHGAPSWKLRGKLLACPALHKSAEPNSLAVRIDFEERAELLAGNAEVYYVTEHYLKYPTVLVRLAAIEAGALQELLERACRFVSPKKRK